MNKQIFAIVLIAVIACLLIVGVWMIALYDHTSALPSDTTTQTTTTETTVTEITTTETSTTETTEQTTTESTTAMPTVTPSGKMIALTFDDGPHPTYTAEILDILEKYNAKATFFVNGYNLSSSRASVLKRAVSLGCEIGNHTENHKRLTELSEDEIYNEIWAVNQKIEALCGYEVKLLRPPYGSISLSVMQAMYNKGLRMNTILWNNDSEDWFYSAAYKNGEITLEEAVQKTYDTIMQWPTDGAILLMHDIQVITPEVLDLLLAKLSAEGYTFVTVSELIDFRSMGTDAYFCKFYAKNKYLNLYEHENSMN